MKKPYLASLEKLRDEFTRAENISQAIPVSTEIGKIEADADAPEEEGIRQLLPKSPRLRHILFKLRLQVFPYNPVAPIRVFGKSSLGRVPFHRIRHDTLKFKTKLTGAICPDVPDFLYDGIFHGSGVMRSSGVQITGMCRL